VNFEEQMCHQFIIMILHLAESVKVIAWVVDDLIVDGLL